jgi:hypothetical protein
VHELTHSHRLNDNKQEQERLRDKGITVAPLGALGHASCSMLAATWSRAAASLLPGAPSRRLPARLLPAAAELGLGLAARPGAPAQRCTRPQAPT